LEKHEGTIGLLAEASIQLAQSGEQAVGLCRHLTLCMGGQSRDAAGEAVGEFPHHGAVPLLTRVEATAQVDDRQARMGRHELQDMLEMVRRVRVYLGGRAHLGETEASESEQRIVSINALLEQGMNVPEHVLLRGSSLGAGLAETSSGRFHDPHSTRPPAAAVLPLRGSRRGCAVLSVSAASVVRGRCYDACARSGRCPRSSSSHAAVGAAGNRSGTPPRYYTARRKTVARKGYGFPVGLPSGP